MPPDASPRPRNIKLCAYVLLFAAGGAIVNVAVAWLAPLRWRHYDSDSRTLEQAGRDWNWLENQGWPVAGNYVWHHMRKGLGWGSDHFALKRPIDMDPSVSAPLTSGRNRSGWPLYALEYYGESGTGDFVQFDKRYGGMVLDGTLIGRRRDHGIFVYNSPLWPGFAINTTFYAAILWLHFAARRIPGFVRRRIRARRGQCPACAYPIGASEVCTECGTAIGTR